MMQSARFDPFITELALPSSLAIQRMVQDTLAEDIGDGDLTAALVPAQQWAQGVLLLREPALVCGQAWFTACFQALDPDVVIEWQVAEGEWVQAADTVVATLRGRARGLLTAERSALNLLQTLSGTATTTARWVAELDDTQTRLLDTRKTVPGLRVAQKYAVRCGGGFNHRQGLWDAVLIKENHIMACGSIRQAVLQARRQGQGRWLEVETETLEEVEQALAVGAEVIMLDNFSLDAMAQAVARIGDRAISEASGNMRPEDLAAVAATGVNYISMGGLTKHLRAIDFSLRFNG